MDIKRFTEYREKVVSSVSRAIVGKERQIELVQWGNAQRVIQEAFK